MMKFSGKWWCQKGTIDLMLVAVAAMHILAVGYGQGVLGIIYN
jgi:hypothetical protein